MDKHTKKDTVGAQRGKRGGEGGRGGSTHVQGVFVDDDEGHAVCHQATGVT